MALERRLEDLEAWLEPSCEGFPPWTLDDRIDAVLEKLALHQVGGPPGDGAGYLYTALEIDALGAATAQQELDGGPGVHLFPSGASVRFVEAEDGGLARGRVFGRVEVSDLPKHVQPFVSRMPSGEQAVHEWLWFEYWRAGED